MDFSPTLDQQRWVDHAARFAAEELRPFADDWDDRGEFPVDCFRKAAGEGRSGELRRHPANPAAPDRARPAAMIRSSGFTNLYTRHIHA